jgi:hypothetical protein
MSNLEELHNHVRKWAQAHPLTPIHVDCATTVMLKILDGKCKMKADSKVVMELLYDVVKSCQGVLLGNDIHALIETSRGKLTDELKNHIYEKRLLAETMISRPVMKEFKAMIKQQGLFLHDGEKVEIDRSDLVASR